MAKMHELAWWWPLLSPPADYEEEAAFYGRALADAADAPIRSALELGSGGGNNASHLKACFGWCSSSRRPRCADEPRVESGLRARQGRHANGPSRPPVRRGLRPRCRVLHDGRRSAAGDRDGVRALPARRRRAVRARSRAGEFRGGDRSRRRRRVATRGAMRYLEWTWDPDPRDTTYTVDYAFIMRTPDGAVRVEHDRHIEGLFSRVEWLRLLSEAGFEPTVVPMEHSELEPGSTRCSWRSVRRGRSQDDEFKPHSALKLRMADSTLAVSMDSMHFLLPR